MNRMILLLLLHVLLGLALIAGRRYVGARAFLIAALAPLGVLIWALLRFKDVPAGSVYATSVAWVPSLDLVFDIRVDAYSLVFLLVIGAVGLPIFLYSHRYFTPGVRIATFAGTMTIFAGSMVGLVVSDHLLALFAFWELTTITSYLLIGFADDTAQARSAALQAALVTGAGGLSLLGGIVLLANEAGSFLISEIVARPPEASLLVSVAWAAILVGVVTKSAQFPFHGWLPGAMAAPTPASAFLHSATMVKAGIYLAGRLAPAAVASTDWWRDVVLVVGFSTMVLGGWRALRQHDLKLLLAFGTVSQLGLLFLLIGSGVPELLFGGLSLLLAHALFKSALFLVVGTIDHEVGTRDIRQLVGLRTSLRTLSIAATLAVASMAAIPLTFGFAAKEAAFDGLVKSGVAFIAPIAIASVLTVLYSGRFLLGVFGFYAEEEQAAEIHAPRNALLWVPLLLATTGIALGLVPGTLAALVAGAVEAIGSKPEGKLVIWPGFVPALGWSLASLGVGTLLLWRNTLVDRVTLSLGRLSSAFPTADGTFQKSVRGLLRFADSSSSIIQNGSLPSYLGIILTTVVVVPSTALLVGVADLQLPPAGRFLDLMVGLLVLVPAIAIVFTMRRFASVILLGAVGFGMAGMFALLGGPDLSLTQLLVETLIVALFAFVLRYLPASFERPKTPRLPRVVVAVGVAAFVFVGGILSFGSRVQNPISAQYLLDSIPKAGGANVVNVILVDFRALDTLGEITVLAAAALGVIGLVSASRSKEDAS